MRLASWAVLVVLAAPATALPICGGGPRQNCIVDGDTLWLGDEKIRLLNIDAPELHDPKCSQEALRAAEARARLQELVVGRLTIYRDGQDRYGRTLARIEADGQDVGEVLVAEGFARRWTGRRKSWCTSKS